MNITSIKQQAKNPNRVSVFIDGKYTLSLSVDELVANKLKIGQVIGETELTSLKKQSADGKVRLRSMEWVLNRPRSVREFRLYLMKKNVDKDLVGKLEHEFLNKGYLDDIRYAAWLVELRYRSGKSQRAINAELSAKGVSSDIVSGIEFDSPSENIKIKALIVKKRRAVKYASDESKLIKYLMGRGFSYSDIKRCLDSDDAEY